MVHTHLATGWDSDASDTTVTTTNGVIANQVPVVTAFTVLSADVGTGTSSSDRAWFNVSQTATIEFRWNLR